MKEIKEEKVTLTYKVLENGNLQFFGPPLGVELWEAWMKKQSIEQHNTLLETQAIALEGMRINKKTIESWKLHRPDRYEDWKKEAYGHNQALQQAADHLRSQKTVNN